MKRGLLLFAVVLLAGCGGDGGSDSKKAEPKQPSVFDYDSSAPVRFVDRRILNPGKKYPVKVHDISYAGWKGRQVNAFLVVPPGKGPFGAVVYMHGSGQSRVEFIVEAAKLARKGYVGLLVDAPWVRGQVRYTGPAASAIRDQYVGNIVDIRRGLDMLAERDDVDMKRIGFLGHSYGGQIGAILSGVEPRMRALDVMAAAAHPSQAYADTLNIGAPGRKTLASIDPVNYVSRPGSRELFIQAGRRDEFVPRDELTSLIRAAAEPKRVKWYATGHALSNRAFTEGENWLVQELAG